MKRISILAIIVFTVLIAVGLVSEVKNVIDGWDAVDENYDNTRDLVSLRVTKIDATLAVDSLQNSALGKQVPYRIEAIHTFIQESVSVNVLTVFMAFAGLFAFYGFYCLI